MPDPDPHAPAHPPPGTQVALDPRDLPGRPLSADQVLPLEPKEVG